jgi:cytochrome bd ubiquinol oxidase subunit II
MSYNDIWFILMGVILTAYGVLDGFDFGVGIMHLRAKTDEERRLIMNSIGPLWDGNEVWLVVFGGALFAAFPNAYATAFSGYYVLIMMLICALIFRAVSIEFRSKKKHPKWRQGWDISFSISSAMAAFIFGVIVGNLFIGLPIGADMEYHGSTFAHFNSYTLLVGCFAVAACAMHGSIYLYLKTEGELQKRVHGWMWETFGIFLFFYMLTTIFTLIQIPDAVANFKRWPWAAIVVVLNVLAIANIPRAIYLNKPGYAFISSICTLAAFTFLFGVAMYPNLLVSSDAPQYSLNIYNSASSHKTLGIMLIVAAMGLPCVLSYTAVVYWIFRGKVQLGKMSY